jgi:hypothetical protein
MHARVLRGGSGGNRKWVSFEVLKRTVREGDDASLCAPRHAPLLVRDEFTHQVDAHPPYPPCRSAELLSFCMDRLEERLDGSEEAHRAMTTLHALLLRFPGDMHALFQSDMAVFFVSVAGGLVRLR